MEEECDYMTFSHDRAIFYISYIKIIFLSEIATYIFFQYVLLLPEKIELFENVP